MPTTLAILRSPFISRTAQPLYSDLDNSTHAQLYKLGMIALSAMVDVEPCGSGDMGGDPSDKEPPSLSSASPSEDDDPEDPDALVDKRKRKKKKGQRNERHRSKVTKAIGTSKIFGESAGVQGERPQGVR